MNMIYTPQGKVDTLIEGTGSPIMFIHGTSAQASIWLPIIQALQLNIDWQCICLLYTSDAADDLLTV